MCDTRKVRVNVEISKVMVMEVKGLQQRWRLVIREIMEIMRFFKCLGSYSNKIT